MSYAASTTSNSQGPFVTESSLKTVEPHGWPVDRQWCESIQFTAGNTPGDRFFNQPPSVSSPLDFNGPHGQQHFVIRGNTQVPLNFNLSTRALARLCTGRTFHIDNLVPAANSQIRITANPVVGVDVRMFARGQNNVIPFTTMTTPAAVANTGEAIEFSVYYGAVTGTNNAPDLAGPIVVFVRTYPALTAFV